MANSALMDKIRRILPRGEFGRNVVILTSSTAFAQVLGVIIAPLNTRLYAPDDYGVVSVLSSISTVLLVLGSLRYDWAIPVPKEDESAANLLALSLLILLGISLALGLGAWLMGDQIANWGQMSSIKPYLWFLPLGLLGAGTYQVLSAWAIRQKDFTPLAKTKIRQSLSGAMVTLGLGVLRTGTFGLLLGNIVGRAAGIELLATLTWRKNKGVLRKVNITQICHVAHRYRRFPLFSTGSSLLNIAGLQIMPIVLAAFYGPTVVGWFALSRRVVDIPITFIGNAVARTFWAEAARLIHDNPKALQKLFYMLTRKLLLFSLVITLIGIASPRFMGIIFGGRWKMAGMYALYLTPMYSAKTVASTLSHLVVHELQHWQFLWDAGRLVVAVACLSLGGTLSWLPGTTIAAYSLSMSLMYGILYIMNVRALQLRIRADQKQ